MRKILSYALSIMLFTSASQDICAQTEKNQIYKVAVGEMSYTPHQSKATVGSVLGTLGKAVVLGKITSHHDKHASSVRASIVSGFGKVRRFHAIDGLFKEGEITENTPALYVEGTINNISTTTEIFTPVDKKSKPYDVYKAQIEVVVHVKDVHDDHIVDSHTFNVADYDLGWVADENKALNDAFILLTNKVTKHYNKLFPLSASIIEAGDTKKDKQKEVYIDLGVDAGAFEGMKLTVYSVKVIADRNARKELGQIKVKEVMGDDISLCKVQSGGKNIKNAIDEGETIIVISNN